MLFSFWMCWTAWFPNLLASRFFYKYKMAFKTFPLKINNCVHHRQPIPNRNTSTKKKKPS
ncbi:hypothetical protein DAPPUDRAFT_309027 [Daphnia pulex]|uniref:Uncharacterized protein n=1 Tax=Daphnia pulex TaxID=6669 RepID=E9G431_DAPPU|nr:hypothetical protein DAPPUDRAFT_309027 [Daphnia pulex]|eukprot:EFX85881.1 hypothetical protein DAPPUDRAFT_309027 [Daphnia pulex]